MSETNTATTSNVNAEVLAIADVLEKNHLQISADLAVTEKPVEEGSRRAYYATLPSDLTPEQADGVHRHDNNFAAGSILAGGRMIRNAMGDSKETKTGTISVMMGDVINAEGKAARTPNSIEGTVVTNRTIHKPGSTTGETMSVPVTVMPTFNTVVDGKTGAMGTVLKDLKGLWAEAASK